MNCNLTAPTCSSCEYLLLLLVNNMTHANRLSLQGQPDADGEQPVAPSPPSSFKFEGENFVLHKSFSVRQSLEVFPGSPEALAGHVLSESILDLESQQKSTACEASAFICFFIWLHHQHI